ncbi:hypothetical protein BDW42DRAFT_188355 [Aspergillus taichungensis]|uniref:4'-phosphopantetheinyl transferase domain-containing protein n=1 Tax=Aspergillus taichungensis TaxID=482145 RepID=A0A2J5HIX3_9EURO|nr:hypothetical protein BDW42DRAFT_188355 [Aspergillus taichungensis]
MVVYYQIAGKKVGSHFLSMGVLGSMFGGVFLATRGGGEKKQATPPIQAESKDEETFIQKPIPFPLPLTLGTDIVHLPRITRLVTRPGGFLTRFTRRILHDQEQRDFRARFGLFPNDSDTPPQFPVSGDMTRWLAGRFAAKEAARKAAPGGAASLGWKDVLVRAGEEKGGVRGAPEVVYLGRGEGEPDRLGRLSISHDGEYVVATVLAAG